MHTCVMTSIFKKLGNSFQGQSFKKLLIMVQHTMSPTTCQVSQQWQQCFHIIGPSCPLCPILMIQFVHSIQWWCNNFETTLDLTTSILDIGSNGKVNIHDVYLMFGSTHNKQTN
jgi:hypothetical protein